jgi:uncharacterized phage-associated protein
MPPLNTRFNLQKTLQAVAYLIRMHPNDRLNYTKALKLLYIAERELLAETGLLLTADHPCAMDQGPVLSRTYNLIKGQAPRQQQDAWNQLLLTHGYDLVLKQDPGHGELSKGIRRKLEEVTKRYENLTGPQLNEATHDFPEWQRHYVAGSNSSFPFDWEEVMAHQGKSAEEIQNACQHEATRQTLEEIFGG